MRRKNILEESGNEDAVMLQANFQVKTSKCVPVFPSKKSHLFSKKKKYDNILLK